MRGIEGWQALRRVIAGADRFLLTSHVFPEGDAIGSEVALAQHLRLLGKEVVICNDGPPTERYRFLTRHCPVHLTEDAWPEPGWIDAAICVDVSSWDYLGAAAGRIRAARPVVVSIDHHRAPAPFGDLDLIVEDAAATGEILYRYLTATEAQITPGMAEALYAAILFDTWGFRQPNTDNETLRLATEILARGVDHRAVCTHLFEADSFPKLDLLRLALGTLRSECGGRLAWLVIPEDLFLATGAEFADGDGILDNLLSLREVEICVMFRQQGNRGVKATFRSKGSHDVGSLARELGGGGRATASGVLLSMSISDAVDRVLPRVHALVGGARWRLADPELILPRVSGLS
jgi:bifunctional oligoribonuclease and PAP phosphatase NrnA